MRSRSALRYVVGALVGAIVPALVITGQAWAQEEVDPVVAGISYVMKF